MDLPEPFSHSFIVKIWIEERAVADSMALWRGHITHVPSGERAYFQDLAGVAAFIAPYLEELGASQLVRWWEQPPGGAESK
jgi:hypothetical protein